MAGTSGDLIAPRFLKIAEQSSGTFSVVVFLPFQEAGSDVVSGGSPQYMVCVAPNVDRSQIADFPNIPTLYPNSDVVYCGLVSAGSIAQFTITYESIEPWTLGCYAYCKYTPVPGDSSTTLTLSSVMDDFVTIAMEPEGMVVYVEDGNGFRMSDCAVVGREVGMKFVDSLAFVFNSSISLNSGNTSYIVKSNSTVTESNVSKSARS